MNKLDKLTISVQELSEVLGISKVTAYKVVNTDGFPVLKLGKRVVVPVEALHEWLKENTTKVGA